jgi:BirA family biotin operon repressor/biotin-[acetyl-CoA-carboxylase] ligase
MRRIIGNKIIRIEETESTNAVAKKMALDGEKEGTVIIARRQSKGRGRMGRSFFSPDGKGIYMSVIIKPENPVLITSFASVAVARAIKKVSGAETQIKWVNDVYLNSKKICGILTEGVYRGDELRYAVLGIGVNVKKMQFPEDISDIAASVENEIEHEISKEILENQIIEELDTLYDTYKDGKFLDESRERSMVIGREINVIRGNETETAMAVDIDDKGGLVIEKDGKRHVLYSGEISIRIKE